MNNKKCPKCNEMSAEFIQGGTFIDRRLEQYHCCKCHYTFITTHDGKFVREGHLIEPYVRGIPEIDKCWYDMY